MIICTINNYQPHYYTIFIITLHNIRDITDQKYKKVKKKVVNLIAIPATQQASINSTNQYRSSAQF